MPPFFAPETLAAVKASLAANPGQLLIDGQWRPSLSGATLDAVDPATGSVLGQFAAGTREDIDLAVRAARKAFDGGAWGKLSPAARARLLINLADRLEAVGEAMAITESLDNGMSFMMAKFGGVMGSSEMLRYFAGWATKVGGETITPSWPGEWQAYTLREPVGVVGAIVPWNVPLIMAVAKLAPALAAGCTIVLKPAEQTSLSALRLGQLILDAGFPPGVVNIVTGLGETAGAALVDHPLVDKIAFTGSTEVGRAIVRAVSGNLKRLTLELGGKSPSFIFPDADLTQAIPAAAMGIFGNTGQVCAATSRLFVHEKVYDEVCAGLAARARSIRVGPGLAPETEIGPVVSEQQLSRVLGYVDQGQREGARLLAGGGRIGSTGYFVEPTIFTETTPAMRIVREEIFGPVLCVRRFGSESLDELALYANDTEYGLNSAIWTRDLATAHGLAKRIRAGMVRINGGGPPDPAMPLGGYKLSGWGRENGRMGLEAYTEIKTVSFPV